MKRIASHLLAAAIVLIAMSAQNARAESFALPVVQPGGAWTQFNWFAGGNPRATFVQNAAGDIFDSIVLTTAQPVSLDITDAFRPGDAFDIIINGVSALSTPGRAVGTLSVTNPNLAFANPAFSSGRIALAPGSYSISIFLREGPSASGGAFIRATAVPEPATLLLLGTGLAAAAGAARKRRGR